MRIVTRQTACSTIRREWGMGNGQKFFWGYVVDRRWNGQLVFKAAPSVSEKSGGYLQVH